MTPVRHPTRLIPAVTLHEHGGWAYFIRGVFRCSVCTHRLTVNGVSPIATRRRPWRAPFEIIDRYRTKHR